MSVKIMSAIWEDAQVNSRAELLLLLALGDYANDKGECWPSIETLAKKARCKQRAVQNLVSSLIVSGKLEVEYNAGPRGTNVYRLIMGGCSGCGGASSREKNQEIKSGIKKQPDAPDPSGSVSNHQESLLTTSDCTKGTSKKFIKPSIEEMKLHGVQIGLSEKECEKAFYFYESNGWRVGKNPMRSWHGAMQTWKRNAEERGPSRGMFGRPQQPPPNHSGGW